MIEPSPLPTAEGPVGDCPHSEAMGRRVTIAGRIATLRCDRCGAPLDTRTIIPDKEETVETQEEIEEHNRRELWKDAANHLTVAMEALGQAQSALDDLDVQHISENLTPHVEGIARFRDLAHEKVEGGESDA